MLGIEHSPVPSENQLRLDALFAYSTLLGQSDDTGKKFLPRGSRLAPLPSSGAKRAKATNTRNVAALHQPETRVSVSQVFDDQDGISTSLVQASARASAVTKRRTRTSSKPTQPLITVVAVPSLTAATQKAQLADNTRQDHALPSEQPEEAWGASVAAWDEFNEHEQYDVNAGWKQQSLAEPSEEGTDAAAALEASDAHHTAGAEEVSMGPSSTGGQDTDVHDAAAPSTGNHDEQEWEDAFAQEGYMDEDDAAAADNGGGATEEQEQAAGDATDEQAADDAQWGTFSDLLNDDDEVF